MGAARWDHDDPRYRALSDDLATLVRASADALAAAAPERRVEIGDRVARALEQPLSPDERDAMQWQDVTAEPPGIVAINRYRDSPHPRVSFANDFARRLEPQPGMKVVYARTRIVVEHDQVRKLSIGYSDDVSVFLNGQILFRGRSAQNFRDPAFLGIVDAENDAVYLPLKKGSNELLLAVSELGGGWGFICRLSDALN